MIAALIVSTRGPNAPDLAADLDAVGISVTGQAECTEILHNVLGSAPDIVICFHQSPDEALFAQLAALRATAPVPVAVFTNDPDATKIASATRSGVHAYVVAGYGRPRLRPVIHLAQARFREEQTLRGELAELRRRFEERKLVDRAKGILMGARSLREEEAYRALRSAAMSTKQRIGQTAQLVIDQAHYAEAVNRAGQIRMLSQRLVKLYALRCAGVDPGRTGGLLADCRAQIEGTLGFLGRSLSQVTFGDLLEAHAAPWLRLKALLDRDGGLGQLPDADALAEEILGHSERLTANLEVAAFANSLHVINVVGRQRMLSQRLAKLAVMQVLLPGDTSPIQALQERTATEFADGLTFLRLLPLSNAEISRELEAAGRTSDLFQAALAERQNPAGRERIATISEDLLGHFERLTDMLERAIQAFVG